jgi:uncharacterized membrane protein
MIHIFGYAAIIINLYAMSRKNVMSLRVLSVIANTIYTFYGVLLNSPPLIIGGVIVVGIHLYQIRNLRLENNQKKDE